MKDPRVDAKELSKQSGTVIVMLEPEKGKMQTFECRKCGAKHTIFVADNLVKSVLGFIAKDSL